MVRAVVFDLDGTLIDSRADLAGSVNAMLARMGLPQLEERVIVGFVGEGAERLIRRSLGAHEARYDEAAPIWRDEYGRRLLDKTRLYDGIAEIFEAPPHKRAVLTNKPARFTRAILEGLHIDKAFTAVRGGDEGPRKPAPDGLLHLCGALGVEPKDALMVGDSPIDLRTAQAAGVPNCAVLWGLGEPAALSAADYKCSTPADLLTLLRSRAS